MAKAKITYGYNNKTGKRVINIDYQSDFDKTQEEHEQEHKELVDRLLGEGLIKEDDDIDISISREQEYEEDEAELEERLGGRKGQEQ